MRKIARTSRRSRIQRRWSEWLGRVAEHVAAMLLILKGYRILARRWPSPFGELDLIAVRGRRLAFVEVKLRRSLQTAELSITNEQANRMAAAAQQWVGRRRGFHEHHVGLDAVLVVPWKLPVHIPDAIH